MGWVKDKGSIPQFKEGGKVEKWARKDDSPKIEGIGPLKRKKLNRKRKLEGIGPLKRITKRKLKKYKEGGKAKVNIPYDKTAYERAQSKKIAKEAQEAKDTKTRAAIKETDSYEALYGETEKNRADAAARLEKKQYTRIEDGELKYGHRGVREGDEKTRAAAEADAKIRAERKKRGR